jgi:hypothetical protein
VGLDYEDNFSLVAMYTSIRMVISLDLVMKWKIHQMYVRTLFLNGVIEEEIYIEKPQGFEIHGRKTHVCKLMKALYGLKKEFRAWYSRIDGYFRSLGLAKSYADPNLYLI